MIRRAGAFALWSGSALPPEVVSGGMAHLVELDGGWQACSLEAALEPIVDARRTHRPRDIALRVDEVLVCPASNEIHL